MVGYEQIRLSFSVLESWAYPLIKRHTYDFVSDTQIEAELSGSRIDELQLAESWSSLTDNHSTKSDNPIHPLVIAKLVRLLRANAELPPITIIAEEDIRQNCGYCVTDGNHRLRAYLYCGVNEFEALVRGDTAAISSLFEASKLQ